MHLTKEQVKAYEENGFVLLPEYFSPMEVEIMKSELPALFIENTPSKVFEKDKNTVRAVHGSHTTNEIFRRLAHHGKLVEPAMQLLGSKVYIYQFKINAKAAFSGDVWTWHQDYIFWHKEDGLPTARIVNVMVLLDDMTEFNGSLFVIPGSHKEGMIDIEHSDINQTSEAGKDAPRWISNFTANLKYSLNQESVAELITKYGIFAVKASAGSILIFNSNIVHASPSNISPFTRSVAIITYNSIENIPLPVKNPRPEFLVSRNYQPVEPLADEALLLANLVQS